MSVPFALTIAAFLAIGAIGMPIGFAMLASGIGYLFLTGQDVSLAAERMLNRFFDGFVLLAVPLFIFAANVMNAGTITDRLLEFCNALVGRFRGCLAQVDIPVLCSNLTKRSLPAKPLIPLFYAPSVPNRRGTRHGRAARHLGLGRQAGGAAGLD